MGRVVLAFDKFRGTATAQQLTDAATQAIGSSARVIPVPLADGGEGSLEVLGGANKTSLVTGPLGDSVNAGWRLDGRDAFIEMAAASGLTLIGGAEHNDALAASSYGTGELISQAVELGARRISVFLGGSATTDGGLGAIRAMPPAPRMKEIELVIACDVETLFTDAARVFGPQKGAGAKEVEFLTRRLERLVQIYQESYGVDVSTTPGAGAAGGLAGGLLAVGGQIMPGFDLLAERAELDVLLEDADLVITGEGFLDAESFKGKVVGGVHQWATEVDVPVLAVVGATDLESHDVPAGVEVVSLSETFGHERAMAETASLVAQVVESDVARRFGSQQTPGSGVGGLVT